MGQSIAMEQAQAEQIATTLADLATPCLVLDAERMERNIARLKARLDRLGVTLRPHLKTAKSVERRAARHDVAVRPCNRFDAEEAEQFAAAGVRDIIYAVGIAPAKLPQVLALRAEGVDLTVLLDSVEQAEAVAAGLARRPARASGADRDRLRRSPFRACCRRRGAAARASAARCRDGAELRGVLTHAGASYVARGPEALRHAAEQERRSRGRCRRHPARRRAALPGGQRRLDADRPQRRRPRRLTEVRAGVFVFFDLVMAGIGVCQVDDIALSVLATVIGHQRDKGWILVDAGWMAMSRDRGTPKQAVDQGYGVVCDHRRHALSRPDRRRRQPGARDHRGAAGVGRRAARPGDRRPRAHPAQPCLLPPARSIEPITSCAAPVSGRSRMAAFRGLVMSASRITAILTDRAPKPAGHYAQAFVAGETLYISGQLPIRADGAPLADDGFEAQARQAIENMLAILALPAARRSSWPG